MIIEKDNIQEIIVGEKKRHFDPFEHNFANSTQNPNLSPSLTSNTTNRIPSAPSNLQNTPLTSLNPTTNPIKHTQQHMPNTNNPRPQYQHNYPNPNIHPLSLHKSQTTNKTQIVYLPMS